VFCGSTPLARLEGLTPNAAVCGILPGDLVPVVNVRWFGSEALELTYKTPVNGRPCLRCGPRPVAGSCLFR